MSATGSPAKTNKQYQVISLSPGVIEGGYEQIILDILPGVIGMKGVKYWSFERVGDYFSFARILLDISKDELPDALEYCEGSLADKIKNDAQLVMLPLIEISSREKLTEEDVFWGVRHSSIGVGNEELVPEAWKVVELQMCELAQKIIKKVRTDNWDRKTIAPGLLFNIISQVVGNSEVSTLSHQIMDAILEGDTNKFVIARSIRESVHKLKKDNVKFLFACEEVLFDDEALFNGLCKLGRIAKYFVHEDGAVNIKLCADIWQRFINKIGFSNLEAAYIACMVSVDSKGSG